MKPLLQEPPVQSPDPTDARVHSLEERIDHLASEEEHLHELEEPLELRTSE